MNREKISMVLLIDLGACIATFLFAKDTQLLFLIYILLSILLLLNFRKDFPLYAAGVLAASIFEPIAVSMDVWSYPASNIAGVPLWIPLMWGLAFVSAYRLGDFWFTRRV